MKYPTAKKYIQESIITNSIEISLGSAIEASKFLGDGIGLSLKQLSNIYSNNGGVSYYVVGLKETINEFITIGNECNKIQDQIQKKYCKRKKYNSIIDGLKKLKDTGCENSTNSLKCKIKIEKEILNFRNKIEKISSEIYKLESDKIKTDNAYNLDSGE